MSYIKTLLPDEEEQTPEPTREEMAGQHGCNLWQACVRCGTAQFGDRYDTAWQATHPCVRVPDGQARATDLLIRYVHPDAIVQHMGPDAPQWIATERARLAMEAEVSLDLARRRVEEQEEDQLEIAYDRQFAYRGGYR